MNLSAALANEFKHESVNTRKMLECLPFEKAAWKPHEKSFTLISLATHIARIPQWVDRIISADSFDVGTANAIPKLAPIQNLNELLLFFDKNCSDALKGLELTSEEVLMKQWTLRQGDKIFFTLPKAAVIRNMGFNHSYHHRGQLSVYLRLLNIPLPGIYGPSADETR